MEADIVCSTLSGAGSSSILDAILSNGGGGASAGSGSGSGGGHTSFRFDAIVSSIYIAVYITM